jgi:hypothetical protein
MARVRNWTPDASAGEENTHGVEHSDHSDHVGSGTQFTRLLPSFCFAANQNPATAIGMQTIAKMKVTQSAVHVAFAISMMDDLTTKLLLVLFCYLVKTSFVYFKSN